MLKKIGKQFFIITLFSLIIMLIIYFTLRFFLIILHSDHWYDKFLGFIFLGAELFLLIHSFGYLIQIKRVFFKYRQPEEDRPEIPKLETNPYVAVLIPSYHEPLNIVEDTIIGCYNLTYRNKEIFLLDDTKYDEKEDPELVKYKSNVEELCKKYKINLFRRKWRGAKAGIINDYLAFVQKVKNKDFNFISFEDTDGKQKLALEKPKYMVILDADQNPFLNFVEPLVAIAEKDEKIAFVQTPQYYTNFQTNRVANSAGMQQVIFYEYICSGKGLRDSMFCCGSNVLMRTDALLDIGGFDENTVTEDAASSLSFHLKGWKSKYYNKVGVFGMGPEDMTNYFKQQFRWAMGAADLFKKVIINFIKNPLKLNFVKWWEYFLSTSFYFSSLIYVIIWVFPILYLLFGIPSFFVTPIVYGVIFVPYFILSIPIFYWTLKKRQYKTTDILKGQFLLWIAFPVIIKAYIYGLFGKSKKKKFEVTAKKGTEIYPYSRLWPQFVLGLISFISIVWGVNRLFYERFYIFSIVINMFWVFYTFIIISYVFYFNVPKKVTEQEQFEQ